MSVSDPLIKDIKGCTLKLYTEGSAEKVSDSNRNLLDFCHILEKIFYKGLAENHGIFNTTKKIEPFNWMASLTKLNTNDSADFNFKNSIEEVQSSKNIRTSLGKFRLLIRHCLMKRCLHFPVQALNDSNKSHLFYEKNSVIGDEILSKILVSVLLQCNRISFDLRLENSSFLDSTWQIPDLIRLELVPCRNLGISMSFSENKAVIVQIRSNSVTAECGKISPGDILANLNGVEINSSCKGRLSTILKLSKGKPVTMSIIKAYHKGTRDVFQPIKSILRNLQIDLVTITGAKLKSDQEERQISESTKFGSKATYLGCVDVGSKGSVKQIEDAMKIHLTNGKNKTEKLVMFEIGEMNIKVVDIETKETIFKHSYMQISSCGSAPNLLNYVAYIAGDENCDTASNFVCYIFYVESVEDAGTILQSIGQGFYRTHYAV